jgi:hypothetical protein
MVVAAASLAFGLVYYFLLRPWHRRWGATDEECRNRLPGDDVVPHPRGEATHGITINAPAAGIWPWLVQIGQDKGGFYSYSWLENLVGCHLRNADRIRPEFQTLQIGDKFWLHPKAPPLSVLIVEPLRALVLGSNTKEPGTWGFYLKEIDSSRTRLIVRGRADWNSSVLRWLGYYCAFEPAHFVMEQKMMRGIKLRAERAARSLKAMTNKTPGHD